MQLPRNRSFWIYLAGIVSVIFLGYAILFRPAPKLPPEEVTHLPPDSAFKVFLNDEMDYKTDFSYQLVQKRIERLRDIAVIYPEKKSEAYRVIDSLKARLKRGAVIKKSGE
jgi:hypothetical protein